LGRIRHSDPLPVWSSQTLWSAMLSFVKRPTEKISLELFLPPPFIAERNLFLPRLNKKSANPMVPLLAGLMTQSPLGMYDFLLLSQLGPFPPQFFSPAAWSILLSFVLPLLAAESETDYLTPTIYVSMPSFSFARHALVSSSHPARTPGVSMAPTSIISRPEAFFRFGSPQSIFFARSCG